MNCDEIRLLLEANSDGELDPMHQLELETHLRTCADCALRAKAIDARRGALRDSLQRFAAPPQFREKIRSLIRAEEAPATRRVVRSSPIGWSYWNLGGLAASVAIALVAGYGLGNSRAHTNALLNEAISDHVRSLQAGHLLDVVSTDQHTVKPWFSGKLDFSPPVVDLADIGFPLAGGRLERLDDRPAAALIFHRRLHSVNLFVWSAASDKVPARGSRGNGYNSRSWSQAGLNFLAVSDISPGELDQFADEFRRRTQ